MRRALVTLVVAAVAFVAGIGLGEALHDDAGEGDTQTLVRTVRPLPPAPLTTLTVTVTTAGP